MTQHRQIAVSLFHRGNLSRGKNRHILEHKAYHWGILVLSESNSIAGYDATDASEIDPVTFRLMNPTMEWWLRIRSAANVDELDKFLGYVILGNVPVDVSDLDLEQLFKSVPLPVLHTAPQQSCVSWTMDAIASLQSKNWLRAFDTVDMKHFTLRFADTRVGSFSDRMSESYGNPRTDKSVTYA